MALSKEERRQRIKHRIRKTVKGTKDSPRLCVYRSNNEIYAQLIDDKAGFEPKKDWKLIYKFMLEKELLKQYNL